MSDSTVTRINEEYGREQFKDFEIDINDGGRGDEGGDVLPHSWSFQIFIDTVTIKLAIDILVYGILVIYSVLMMIMVALEYQIYFQTLYEDYDTALAWKRIISDLKDDKDIDYTSADYLLVQPLFPQLHSQADKLSNLYAHSYVATTLTTICSFRTIVNILFAKLTDRPFKVTEVTQIDFFLIFYWIFFLIILFVYQ